MALLNSIAEIKEYVAINFTMADNTLVPYTELAEREHLIPILGQALYNKLVDEYHSSASASSPTVLEKLLKEVQWALAYLTMYEFLTHIASAQISDAGIMESFGNDQKAARKWVNDQIQASHRATAFKQLDVLLQFLEAKKADYPDWVATGSYTEYFDCLAYNTAVFEQYYSIGNSRRVFLSLKPFIRSAETIAVVNVLGQPLYNELLTQQKAGNLTPANAALISYARKASVFTALQEAVPMLSVKVTERGLTLDASEGTLEENSTQKPASADRLGAYWTTINKQASSALGQLRNYLEANKATYPLYVPYTVTVVNDSEKKGWVF